MIDREAILLAHWRARSMRPDAARFIREDAARFLIPGTDPADVYPALALKYSPSQRRVPAGDPRGGQWTREDSGGGGGGSGSAGGSSETDGDVGVDASDSEFTDSVESFAETDTSDAWTDLIGDDLTTPREIPNASIDDVPENLEEVNARRGTSPNRDFPGASNQQLFRLDQAIARSENAQTQIRQYEPDWRPSETSLTAPGSIEGAVGRAEARAAEAESRLDQLRTGLGGNFGPPLQPARPSLAPSRVFDGGAWIDAYRTINNAPNLFGEPLWPKEKGTVAVSEIDGQLYFGINSTALGYTDSDWNRAARYRDGLIEKYPLDMNTINFGYTPNDSLFHAESTILLRAATERGGSLSNRSIEIVVDREVCSSCGAVLPKLAFELGNPYVVFTESRTGFRSEMWNGRWLSGRYK